MNVVYVFSCKESAVSAYLNSTFAEALLPYSGKGLSFRQDEKVMTIPPTRTARAMLLNSLFFIKYLLSSTRRHTFNSIAAGCG
jgi:hypothetical protein